MTGPLRPEDVDGFFAEADGRDASESESPRTEPCAARITNGAHVRVTPEIQITAKLRENTDEAIAALRADDNLYQRDGRLVHITRITREESERSPEAVVGGRVRRALVEGSPQIRELALATLTERLSHVAAFKKRKQGRNKDGSDSGWVPTLPSAPIVAAVFHRGEWSGLPQIVGIVEAPTMRPDGSIIQTAGYDHATGFMYAPSDAFAPVPEAPTQEDARKALAALDEIFIDFPYVNDAHRAVSVAAALTMLARPAILGSVPAFLFDASNRGTGKTLQTDAIAILATGRGAPRMNFPIKVYITSLGQSVSVDDAEMEKVLASYALRGAALICLDNIVAPFGGAPLDRVLTARDSVELRVLGRSEVPTLPWRAVVLGTGNNLECLRDTARRTLRARIESLLENPESRTDFRHPDLLGWLRAERPRLVVAGLTVLRAFVVAGRPNTCDRWGSFEEWSALIPPAIVFAGGSDPMGARMTGDVDRDDDTQALVTILVELPKLHVGQLGLDGGASLGPTAQEIITGCYPEAHENDPPPDPHRELRLALESLVTTKRGTTPSAKALGKALAHLKGRVVSVAAGVDSTEDRRLAADPDRRTKRPRWRSETLPTRGTP